MSRHLLLYCVTDPRSVFPGTNTRSQPERSRGLCLRVQPQLPQHAGLGPLWLNWIGTFFLFRFRPSTHRRLGVPLRAPAVLNPPDGTLIPPRPVSQSDGGRGLARWSRPPGLSPSSVSSCVSIPAAGVHASAPRTRVPDRVLQAECAVSDHATNFPLKGNKVCGSVGRDVALRAQREESGCGCWRIPAPPSPLLLN